MNPPDEYEEIARLAALADANTPWRDQPRPYDITPKALRHWIGGPVRNVVERLAGTSAADSFLGGAGRGFVFPWPPGVSWETYLSTWNVPHETSEEEVLSAVAYLTFWQDKLIEPSRTALLTIYNEQIDRFPAQVAVQISRALEGVNNRLILDVGPLLRKAIPAQEAYARVVRDLQARAGARGVGKRRRRPALNPDAKRLTDRQTEVVQIVGECKGSFAEAGRRLRIDRKTVADHYQAAMRKMGKVGVRTPERILRAKTTRLPVDHRGQVNL
jgi:DNA-binding CsgD family transcriptional regulator